MAATRTSARFGVPYQGSKNRIAARIVDLLPKAQALVDALAGGCAVTHAALLSGKFGRVIANDLSDAPELFYYCLRHGVPEKPRWVSRAEFLALKDKNPLIRYCYSFKNDGTSYLYGREVEPLKRAVHRAVVDGDFSELPNDLRSTAEASLDGVAGVAQRYAAFRRAMRGSCVNLAHIWNRIGLESIARHARLAGIWRDSSTPLLVYRRDYRDLYIPDGAVVYCDPPYANTAGYGGDSFDHGAFYSWCRGVGKSHQLFVSEYWMPPDFQCVAEFTVHALAGASTNSQTRVEKIFTL
jgi:site-specific DNA-adenine methylase